MTEPLLAPPASWADEARALPVDEVVLSYYPDQLVLPAGRTITDIEHDLQRGAWLVRQRGTSRYETFRLGGAEFELRTVRRPAKNALARGETIWLAALSNVDEARSVPPRAHRLSLAAVRLEAIYDEVPCDLGEIEARVAEREQHLHGSRARHRGADRGSHGELQRAVRKQYGELATLIELLQERPVPPEATVEGIVIAPHQAARRRPIVVDTGTQSTESFRRQRVKVVTAAGEVSFTQVTGTRGGRLEIAEPRNLHARPGTEVKVSVVPPFGMRQNAEALKSFWAGHVEGSWDDLARLLCEPKTLTLPPDGLPELPFFYSDHDPDPKVPRLNDEQRQAVTGAVGSPHAYLVQGPPGTGKTEVISEIIRQLTGRGERVLLLAPSHVAVDEALHRVGHKPGVRPLRITFSDDKVREGLRVFLPENVGIETANRVLRPVDSGQQARWETERRGAEEALGAIEILHDADRRHASAVTGLRAAAAAASGIDLRLSARRADAEAEIAALARDVAASRQVLTHAQAALSLAVREGQQLRQQREPLLAVLRDTAAQLVRHGEIAIQNAGAERQAVTERDAFLADSQARLASAARARRAAESAAGEARNATNRAWTELCAARGQLNASGAPETTLGRFADRLGLGALAQLRRSVVLAEDQFTRSRATLSARETAWRASTASHQQLAATVAARHDQLHARVRLTTERREDAERTFGNLWREFTAAAAALVADLPSPDPGTVIWHWVQLGQTVYLRIAAVLPPGPDSVQLTGADTSHLLARWGQTWAEAVQRLVAGLIDAAALRQRRGAALDDASRSHDDKTRRLREAQRWGSAEIERLTAESQEAQSALGQRRAGLAAAIAERDESAAALPAIASDPASLARRRHVLEQLPGLAARWRELTAERSDAQLAEDIQQSLVRATNLVCATTKGIVGRGSELVRHADYDTLIVDEASRVTESEFLIGAIRARRWVLVGDQHQLPPHVDAEDEHFVHALAALHRRASGRSPSLEQAVKELGELWKEDEELRQFRDQPVQELAQELESSGVWEHSFHDRFAETHKRFSAGKGEDTDRALLSAMIRYLVQSLFQRAAQAVPETLRQPLVWQRRMIAPLAQLVNVPIYGGLYKSPSDEELAEAGVTPLVTSHTFTTPGVFVDTSHYRDAESTQDNHGCYNNREIELVTRICEIYNAELAERGSAVPVTTSVLTFYSAQARRLERKLLSREDLPMLDWQVIDVIDRIQGQQSDLVIISFTRAKRDRFGSQYGQWLMDTRRLNVACTRARRALVLVGHGDTLRRLGGNSDDRQASRARQFYENLFGLVETDEHFMRKVRL